MEEQIPKIIHYCWFGGKELPEKEKKCIETWKKVLPDYELKFWSEESFDVNSNCWTKSAYEMKKYAFVSDYVRIWALYQYGGLYLDTDVKVLKSFDDLLENGLFACFEDLAGTTVATCVIGARKNHPVIANMLQYYKKSFDMSIIEQNIANVVYFTEQLKSRGLQKNGRLQRLDENIVIFPRTYFCPMDYFGNWDMTENTYCIHYFSGSWLPEEELKKHKRRNTALFHVLKIFYGKLKHFKVIEKIRLKIKKV